MKKSTTTTNDELHTNQKSQDKKKQIVDKLYSVVVVKCSTSKSLIYKL